MLLSWFSFFFSSFISYNFVFVLTVFGTRATYKDNDRCIWVDIVSLSFFSPPLAFEMVSLCIRIVKLKE